FFKPSEGCIHVFHELSIKLVDEICPLGQSTVVVDTLSTQDHRHGKLSPDAFHTELVSGNDFVLMDTRNYYESNIGYFENAIRPPIRKFSQLPAYIERNKQVLQGKKILTYCTGGIRCEKATAYMRQALPENDIFMLDGGIHNYLEWYKQSERKEHVWLGKNYVFDARQSLGSGPVVSCCQSCQQPWDQYKKCMSTGCHLLVLLCDACCQKTEGGVYCCTECQQQNQAGYCYCEKKRKQKELECIHI
ncbi:Thiosulfate sulfurtransferase/rhodanese-like domain-containing protein 2, partial [Choanephora cucurbitarum]